MTGADVDAKFPERTKPVVDSGSWKTSWKLQREYVEYLLSHFARASLGLRVGELDRTTAVAAVTWAYHEAFMTFGYGAGGSTQDSEYWKGVCALLGAALAAPDTVATCSGGKTLGAKVQRSKVYFTPTLGHDLRGLGRHLATAANARLPASHVAAAMAPVREHFLADQLRDPRTALVAAYAWFAHVAIAPDIRAATTAWLEGKSLDLPEGTARQAVADGDDPRARIFEQFQQVLGSERASARQREAFTKFDPAHGFDHRVFQPEHTSDAATCMFLARHPLPAKWETMVDPFVAQWLGAKVTPAKLESRRKAMQTLNRVYKDKKKVRAYVVRNLAFDPAIRALHLGDAATLCAFTGGGTLAPFSPRKFFKDDWKKLLRYLGSAMKAPKSAKVTRADVEPAWFDFLSRPQKRNVTWSNLLALQAVISATIGGADPGAVGRELQLVLTGV